MKYITIASHDALKLTPILFSQQISHADMAAKWRLNKPIGAGFVTFHDGLPACVGFSTSLNLGPSPHDLEAVRLALHMTHIQYPAPTPHLDDPAFTRPNQPNATLRKTTPGMPPLITVKPFTSHE